MMRFLVCLSALALVAGTAHADQVSVTVPAGSAQLDITLDIPAKARVLTLTASNENAAPVDIYLKDGAPFDADAPLSEQAAYSAKISQYGPAKLAIGTYGTPALHQGTWQLAVANTGTEEVTVTLDTAIGYTTEVKTPFVVSFEAPSGSLASRCGVAPWTDATPLDASNPDGPTLGEYRRSLITDTLDELATQVHSPVPIHIQACWTDQGGSDGGGYALASAGPTQIFYDFQGAPQKKTWYAMAPASRLAGHRLCQPYLDGSDCAVPAIVVYYNSNEAAEDLYNGTYSPRAMRSVTMHEITHGLGFLSLLDITSGDDSYLKVPDFVGDGNHYPDAYIANVAWLPGEIEPPYEHKQVLPFLELGFSQRLLAIKSGNYLVWNDPELAASTMNALRGNEPPINLVQLYAPTDIAPGSTLSHFNDAAHPGQLMDHAIQGSLPETLGLAEGVLAKVGWSTGPDNVVPITGTWSDPAHSGHGIDLELTNHDPAGDVYTVLFYTFGADGEPEYYGAGLRLVDGQLMSITDPAVAADLARPVYDPASHGPVYPDGASGSIAIDFTDAISDPACQDHNRQPMALMHWSIGDTSGTWCISPIVSPALRPADAEDLSGVWSAGSSDSGWGLSLAELELNGTRLTTSLLFYYDDDNQSRWGITDLSDYVPGAAVDIYQSTGYCRSCAKAPLTTVKIGTLTLDFSYPENVELPSGDNTLSADIDAQNRYFQRQNTAMRLLSLPAGQ